MFSITDNLPRVDYSENGFIIRGVTKGGQKKVFVLGGILILIIGLFFGLSTIFCNEPDELINDVIAQCFAITWILLTIFCATFLIGSTMSKEK